MRRYRSDFLIKLENGEHLVLEMEGQDSQQNWTKRAAFEEWARGINGYGGVWYLALRGLIQYG